MKGNRFWSILTNECNITILPMVIKLIEEQRDHVFSYSFVIFFCVWARCCTYLKNFLCAVIDKFTYDKVIQWMYLFRIDRH